MARWIKADGTEVHLKSGGPKWTLEELQKAVGGFVQIMPGVAPLRLVMNEDGRALGLPLNVAATAIVHDRLREMGQFREVGQLRYVPQIVGDVLVLEPGDHL